MADKRKPISKKLRFEVFKRDNFTCQYCGRKAPDVVLEVDHLKPVKNGGKNDLLNLVTSCFECNRGKGAREISDNSAVNIQREQLEEKNERIEQMKMIVKWKESVKEEEKIFFDSIIDMYDDYVCGEYSLSEFGENKIKKCIKSFGYSIAYDGMEIAFNQYFKGDVESLENLMNKYTGICNNLYTKENDPDKYYKGRIIAALKSNGHYVDYSYVNEFVEQNFIDDEALAKINIIAKKCTSSQKFWNRIEKEMI